MALKTVSIGSAQDVYQFDDGDTEYGIETDAKIKVDTAPTNPNEVLRLVDIPSSANIVTAAANIADHAVVRGDGGAKGIQDSLVTIDDTGSISLPALQTIDGVDVSVHAATPTAHQDAPGLIATHTAIPAAHHAKYTDAEAVIAAKADGDIADAITKKHTQGTDTALGAVGTKNPPINADKILYRDSAAADVLVTSTWTQIKAFLKTYFDTLYNLYVHPNHSGDVTSVADGATSIVVNIPSDEHLVGYWAFDDGSGTVAVDGSGNGNNGTINGNPTWIVGIVGQCLNFDGTGDYVSTPIITVGAGIFTMSVWINIPSLPSPHDAILGGPANYAALLVNGGNGFSVGKAGVSPGSLVSYNIPFDTWVHVVAIVKTTTTADIYVNGVFIGTSTDANVYTLGNRLFNIGCAVSAADIPYTGKIDEVRIYDTALTASEIKALYLYPAGNKGRRMSALQIGGTLATYANNAAAIAGGLVVGDLYCNGADPDLVCIVH